MFDRLKTLFEGAPDSGPDDGPSRLRLAAACLLVEAARMDGHFDDHERETIETLLTWRFDMSADEAGELIALARQETEAAVEMSTWARTVKDSFSHDERIELLEMLWTVVYADGELHDYEANLMRRVAGLLYVEDRDSGAARKRVLERLDLTGDTE